MTMKEFKEKHNDIVFRADEYVEEQELKKLKARLLDIEKQLENLQNELNIK